MLSFFAVYLIFNIFYTRYSIPSFLVQYWRVFEIYHTSIRTKMANIDNIYFVQVRYVERFDTKQSNWRSKSLWIFYYCEFLVLKFPKIYNFMKTFFIRNLLDFLSMLSEIINENTSIYCIRFNFILKYLLEIIQVILLGR